MLTDSVFDPVLSKTREEKWIKGEIFPRYAPVEVKVNIIRDIFALDGYQIKEGFHYINNTTKIPFICPYGHEHSMSWANWKKGHRCIYCSDAPPITTEIVIAAFQSEGYQVCSEFIYKNAHEKFDFICPEGHNHSICWNKWQNGVRCLYCAHNSPRTEDRKEVWEIQKRLNAQYGKKIRRGLMSLSTGSKSRAAYPLAVELFHKYGRCPLEFEHIDHIVPSSFFDLRFTDQTELCWSINNLRYLNFRDNIARSNKLTFEEMRDFTEFQMKILASASRRKDKYNKWIKELGYGHLLS